MLRYQFKYITFAVEDASNFRLMVELPSKIYVDDGYVKRWLKNQSDHALCNEATDEIMEYLRTLNIQCCWIYPKVIAKDKDLITFGAKGALLDTKVVVRIGRVI